MKNNKIDNDTRQNEWDENKNITRNIDSSYNYSTNGCRGNRDDYTPDTMRADANGDKTGYDIESRTPNKFDDDPILQNNIANAEFDYTKEESNSYLNPEKTDSSKMNVDKNEHSRTARVSDESYFEDRITGSASECYRRADSYDHKERKNNK